jgi:phage terminase large subunit-like protein
LLLANLVGPLAVPNGQIFSCALDREQASAIFHMCRKMIEMTPRLQRYLKVGTAQKVIAVVRSDCRGRGSRYQALSAEASSKHGLGSSFFVYDELGEARDDELLNTMLDGQQAPAEPMAIAISTQNPDPEHCFQKWLRDGSAELDRPIEERSNPYVVAHIHAAPLGCDIMDREAWVAASPTLKTWKSWEPTELAALQAKENPSLEQNFRRRYLNQPVAKEQSLIAAADWRRCEDKSTALVPGEAIYLAYDGAIRTDLAALVAISVSNGTRVKAWCWKPSDYLGEHGKRDHPMDPARYRTWVDRGLMLTSPGRSIDPAVIAMKVAELFSEYEVVSLAYDRWKIDEFIRALDQIGLASQIGDGGGLRLVPWGQGFRDMSPAIDALEHAIVQGELKHDGGAPLNWCVTNAIKTEDAAGNRKLDKSKSSFRIDLAVALAMACGLKARDRAEQAPVNPWEDPTFSLRNLYT